MKKIFKFLLICMMIVSTTACAHTPYNRDKEELMTSINKLATSAKELGQKFAYISRDTGTKYAFDYANKIIAVNKLNVHNYDELFINSSYPHVKCTDALFDTSMEFYLKKTDLSAKYWSKLKTEQNKAFAEISLMANRYETLCFEVKKANTTLSKKIESFQNNYGKRHKEEVDLIVEYYNTSLALAERVIDLSGSVTEYEDCVYSILRQLDKLCETLKIE